MVRQQKNYYQILGLKPDSTTVEIKVAYRTLVKALHPDVHRNAKSPQQIEKAHKETMMLNEAYETLKDRRKRLAYDALIGANGHGQSVFKQGTLLAASDLDEAREKYLRQVFHPSRQSINRLLSKYNQQLTELSQDIYDESLVEVLQKYGDDVELVLCKASSAFSGAKTPKSLEPAELMMRYAIAQAADGLEEIRYFCSNYDYDHLSMASNLFHQYSQLSNKALQLSK